MRASIAIAAVEDSAAPEASVPSRAPVLTWTHHLALVGVLFALVLTLQCAGGAFTAEYGGFPDEAAHFVTGLMVHDYLLSGEWSDPLGFARTFYDHYPKVGLGHWPPVFYVMMVAWMLVFGCSQLAVMLFVAANVTAAAWLLGVLVARRFGLMLGVAASVLFVSLPLVQQYAAMVMMESTMAFWTLLAVALYARYLDRPSWQNGLLFGVVAAMAILTKGSAMALAAIPPLAVLFTRRFELLKSFSFWLPAIVVVLLCGPWYAMTLRLMQNGMTQPQPSWAFTADALGYYAWHAVQLGGAGMAVAVLIGFALTILEGHQHDARSDPLWTVAGACLIGLFAIMVTVPVITDSRHLIPAAPLLILFAARGVDGLARRLARGRLTYRLYLLMLLFSMAAIYMTSTARIPQKVSSGFLPVAESILADPTSRDGSILVSSNSAGEGAAIAEIARRDERPGLTVHRSSRLLSRSAWDGTAYELRATMPDEILALLDEHHVRTIIVDDTTPDYPQYRHHPCLVETIEANPGRFTLEATYPIAGQNPMREGTLRVFRVVPLRGVSDIVDR